MVWHFFVSILFLGFSPNIYKPQLTPICTGFLENMDNSWYRYFFDRVWLYTASYAVGQIKLRYKEFKDTLSGMKYLHCCS